MMKVYVSENWQATQHIKIHFRADVTHDMRLVEENGTAYEITSMIDIDHLGVYLDILAVVRE